MPKKRFCLRGHDTHVVGRDQGMCKECRRQRHREYNRTKRVVNIEKKREYARKWAAKNPEKRRESRRKSDHHSVASGKNSKKQKLARENAISAGKCGTCRRRASVGGLTECQACKSNRRDRKRLSNRYGLPVTIIRELGLDKNLPAPRRENADR